MLTVLAGHHAPPLGSIDAKLESAQAELEWLKDPKVRYDYVDNKASFLAVVKRHGLTFALGRPPRYASAATSATPSRGPGTTQRPAPQSGPKVVRAPGRVERFKDLPTQCSSCGGQLMTKHANCCEHGAYTITKECKQCSASTEWEVTKDVWKRAVSETAQNE